MTTVEITSAIAKREDEIRRLRALGREIKALAADAARVERGLSSKISDADFRGRAKAAYIEGVAIGFSFPDGPFSQLEVV